MRGAQRLGATQGSNYRSDGVDGRLMRNAAEHPLASLPRDEWKGGGSIGSYALRAFDDKGS